MLQISLLHADPDRDLLAYTNRHVLPGPDCNTLTVAAERVIHLLRGLPLPLCYHPVPWNVHTLRDPHRQHIMLTVFHRHGHWFALGVRQRNLHPDPNPDRSSYKDVLQIQFLFANTNQDLVTSL